MWTVRVLGSIVVVVAVAAVVGLVVRDRDPNHGATPTATQVNQVVPPFSDPRALATYFFDRIAAADWEAVQPLLADEYQEFSYGDATKPYDRYVTYIPTGSALRVNPSDWSTEEDQRRVAARYHYEGIPYVISMRRLSDGTLRVDPGPCALQMATFWRARPEGFAGIEEGQGYLRQILVNASSSDQSSALLNVVNSRFGDTAQCVAYVDVGIQITSAWLIKEEGASLPVTGLRWIDGEDHGPAHVIWTDAQLVDGKLTFPIVPMAYTVTILLEDAPPNRGVHLQIEGFNLADPTMGSVTFAMDILPLGDPYPDPNGPPQPAPFPSPTVNRVR